MLLAFASYSACSRSSSDKRMVKFFLGSINCPIRPISNPFLRFFEHFSRGAVLLCFFFFIRHYNLPSTCPIFQTCGERICQIRKTPCVLQNLVRGAKTPLIPLLSYPYWYHTKCNNQLGFYYIL